MSAVTVLVFGGRHYPHPEKVAEVLEALHWEYFKGAVFCVLHGDAPGVDTFADEWAKTRGFPRMAMPAPWGVHGKKSGPLRNGWMLDYGHPSYAVGFPGRTGTADMNAKCLTLGVPVWAPFGLDLK